MRSYIYVYTVPGRNLRKQLIILAATEDEAAAKVPATYPNYPRYHFSEYLGQYSYGLQGCAA